MSDTPRTDTMAQQVPMSKSFASPVTVQNAWASFARQLERSNNDLVAALELALTVADLNKLESGEREYVRTALKRAKRET